MPLQLEIFTHRIAWSVRRSKQFIALATLLTLLAIGSYSHANVDYVGQIIPDPNTFTEPPIIDSGGHLEGEDVIVGDTSSGGIFMDSGFLDDGSPPVPISSLTGVLGNGIDGVGRVEVKDISWSLTGTDPNGTLVVGNEGFGILDQEISGFVNVDGGTIVGNAITGQGQVTIGSIASRLVTNELIVGNDGNGSIRVGTGGNEEAGSIVSTVSVLGAGLTGQGLITLNDTTRWDLRDLLTVGGEGIGDVVLNGTGNIISTTDDPNAAVIGRSLTGQGSVTLNDSSRFFLSGAIVVGDQGRGEVEINAASTLITGDGTIARGGGSNGHVTLNGTSRWDIRGDLGIGVAAGGDPNTFIGGVATLDINDSAYVQVDPNSSVGIARRGELNLGGGTINKVPFPAAIPIENFGVIRGKGRIEALLDINATGELRNASDVANQREKILVTNAVNVAGNQNAIHDPNDGLIESIGGEMEFHGAVTNNGVIVNNGAIMRFRGQEISGAVNDLVNNGLVFMGPDSIIYGDITGSGSVIVDVTVAPAQIFGDLIYTTSLVVTGEGEGEIGTNTISATDGPSLGVLFDDDPAALMIFGDLILDGTAILEVDYISTMASLDGDSYTLVTADNITGTFANTQVDADGRLWDISYLGNDVIITATTSLPGDFDGDGDVDGFDFLEWQRGYPTLYDDADLLDWQNNYGTTPLTPNTAAVPEPSTIVLAMAAMGLCFRRRR